MALATGAYASLRTSWIFRHGACVIPSLVDADHIIEVRGFHCLMDIEQSDFLGGVGKFGAAGSACHGDESRAFERSQGVTNADGVRPGAFRRAARWAPIVISTIASRTMLKLFLTHRLTMSSTS